MTSLSSLLPPWEQSMSNKSAPLLYMSLYKHQLERLEAMGAKELELPDHLAFAANEAKGSRMGSRCFLIDGIFRRIRMTYFDGGTSIQVFNSLWYPSLDRSDAPLLGIDLLSFGANKANRLLCVIDAQPSAGRNPQTQQVSHDTSRLAAIHAKYVNTLGGTPSAKWYEDSRYFSSQMLYGTTETLGGLDGIAQTLLPAFQSYLDAYIDLVTSVDCNRIEKIQEHTDLTLERHAAYDEFNAARDPAHKLFTSYFGEHFAHDYVHNFLFSLSSSSKSSSLSSSLSSSSKDPAHKLFTS
eukprot:CAMPEP_0197348784 /NCGR_PEP_ID=MMETSP0893-20130614/8896_1 /TAXON_ID=44058 ORGANISM="Aureoumbra lagunensis, Strain CCMP1510" /NCGR_SAMPLE_ID=MMETSP0893 /ASSEMBLY_ACC=CAM_ASM_000539 /LENGTH=295 /DNA_ID=CAMNT_0042859599 /DNA_START=200 /DNA_END=1083 /DNA_ORIENTATION=-